MTPTSEHRRLKIIQRIGRLTIGEALTFIDKGDRVIKHRRYSQTDIKLDNMLRQSHIKECLEILKEF